MLRRFLAVAAIVLVASPAAAQLKIQPFVTGLSVPVAFIQDPTDSTIQYVFQQNRHIRLVKSGALHPTDFLLQRSIAEAASEDSGPRSSQATRPTAALRLLTNTDATS